jgi:hypothetical protein
MEIQLERALGHFQMAKTGQVSPGIATAYALIAKEMFGRQNQVVSTLTSMHPTERTLEDMSMDLKGIMRKDVS